MCVNRLGFNFTLGSTEDDLFVTLEPGKPMVFHTVFDYGFHALPGHRYLVDVHESENVGWWKKGRKEDVLNLPGKNRGGHYSDGEPIALSLDEPAELKLLPLDD